jgi:hypothetical protein
MDSKVTFRLDGGLQERAKTLMRRKGIMKMSDFVRQALVSHMSREGVMLDEPAAVSFATTAKPAKAEQTEEARK